MPAMKDLVKGTDRYRHFIGGEWVDSTLKEWIEVENPATGEIIASVPKGSAEDADRAVQAACAAQPAWEALPPQSRGLLLRALARLILENRERLARMVMAEQGKPLHEARGEIEGDGAVSRPMPPRRRGGSPATSSRPTIPTSRSGSSGRPRRRRRADRLELSRGADDAARSGRR